MDNKDEGEKDNKNRNRSIAAGVVVVLIIAIILIVHAHKMTQVSTTAGDDQTLSGVQATEPTYPIDVENQIYTIDDRKIQLVNGTASTSTAPGSVSMETTTLLDGPAFSDLDGDGTQDAVVILKDQSGGSGSFYYAAVVFSNKGDPKTSNAVFLGDRIHVENITINRGGIITIDFLDRNAGEPLSATPTVDRTVLLEVQNDALIQM